MSGAVTFDLVAVVFVSVVTVLVAYLHIRSIINQEVRASQADRTWLRDRLETSKSEIHAKIDALSTGLNSRVDSLRFELVQSYVKTDRMDRIETRLGSIVDELWIIKTAVARIESHENGKDRKP